MAHIITDSTAQYLREALLKIAPIQQVHITTADSVVSSHCGPDTIGILYILK